MAMEDYVPRDALAALYAPVGQLVISWGMIDVAISNTVSSVFMAGGRHKESQIPRQMNRKQKFLRRCFRQIEALHGFAEEGLHLLQEIDKLKPYREGVAHGYPAQFDRETGAYSFWTLEIEEDSGMWESVTHRQIGRTITLRELDIISGKTIDLAGAVVQFMLRLQQARKAQNIGNHSGGGV